MSRKDNCWDNVVAESFFGTLKQECVQWQHYQTRQVAQQDVLHYMTMFYNSLRLHSHLGYRSPMQFERKMLDCKKLLTWVVTFNLTPSLPLDHLKRLEMDFGILPKTLLFEKFSVAYLAQYFL